MAYTITEHDFINDGQIERLYESYLCSYHWIKLEHNHPKALKIEDNGMLLHLVPYVVRKKTFLILLKLFNMDQATFSALKDYIFKNFQINTIQVDLVSKTIQPALTIITQVQNDYVVHLPNDIETYRNVLGRNTRGQLSSYLNRVTKNYDNFNFKLVEKNNITNEMIDKIIDLNHQRMLTKNKISGIGNDYRNKILSFSKHYGFLGISSIGDKIIAGVIGYRLGRKLYIQTLSHDDEYSQYRPGFLTTYMTITEAIKHGITETHLLWGKYDYKSKLGCIPKELICIKSYKKRFSYIIGKVYNSSKSCLICYVKILARKYMSFSFKCNLITPR